MKKSRELEILEDLLRYRGVFTKSQLDDVGYVVGEALEKLRAFDDDAASEMSLIEMPFGKYAGKEMGDVPLRYLDETIAVMPPTYFVRKVIQFVDLAMTHWSYAGCCQNRATSETMNQLLNTPDPI